MASKSTRSRKNRNRKHKNRKHNQKYYQNQQANLHAEFVRKSDLVISVEQARRILGGDAQEINDYQIRKLVVELTDMAEIQLAKIGSKNAIIKEDTFYE